MRKSIALTAGLLLINGCSGGGGGGGSSAPSTNSSVSGKLNSVTVSSFNSDVGVMAAKTITHIVAVSPVTSNPVRYAAAVNADGSFSLGLDSGKPYIIVFVAQNGVLTGPNMIVGMIRVAANGLDSLPLAQSASVGLGTVTVDGTSGEATPSTNVADLLSTLGVTSVEATMLGEIDDLALRLANPDVDGNGVIDATENKTFSIDWHVRANTLLSGSAIRTTDIENQFANPANLTLSWTLASAYAVYASSVDATDYIDGSGNLQNSGGFNANGTAVAASSMSDASSSSTIQWGPDYDLTSQEMGASDAKATFTYTLGTSGKVLTFSNVRTRTKASLNAGGTVIPFIKINTTGGNVTGIDYKWMKKDAATWIDATATEVALIVQGKGSLTLYTQKGGGVEKGLAFSIPSTSVSGTINVNGDGFTNVDVANPTTVTLDDICSTALSYDDKLGLRLFAGAPIAKVGVTACP